MENENDNGVESQENTEDVENNEDVGEDVNALKEKLDKVSEQNKQLFARAKKAEGFVLKDGDWVKETPKETPKPKDDAPSSEPSQPNELDYGQKAYLKTHGISGKEEIALVKQFQERGFDLDNIVEDSVFTSKLNELRESKESASAIPKSKPRSGATGTTDVDLAIAKYKETGELPSDFATRNKVVDAITKEESGEMFSGPSVIKG